MQKDLSLFDARKKTKKKIAENPENDLLLFTLCGDLHDNAIGCVKRNSSIAISSSCFSAFFVIRCSFYCGSERTEREKHFKSIFNFYFQLKRNRRAKERNMRNTKCARSEAKPRLSKHTETLCFV